MATPSPHSACLCWALYRPKVHNNNKDGYMIRQSNEGILWPALRFSTISDFLSVKGGSFDAPTSSNDTNIISILGRPVDEYVNADESEMKDMKVQGYINGLTSFTKRRECRDFTQQFISLCASSCGDSDGDSDDNDDGDDDDDDNRGEATTAAAFDLFQDFYKALDEMVAIYRTDDDMDDSSQDDSDDDDDDDDDVAWASKAQQDWDVDQSLGDSVVAVSSTSKVQHDWDEYQSLGGGDGNDRDNGNWIGKVVVVSSMSSLSSQNDYTSLCIDQPSDGFASSNIRKRKHSNRDSTSTSNKNIMEDTSVPKDGNSTASSSSSNSNNNNNDDDGNNNEHHNNDEDIAIGGRNNGTDIDAVVDMDTDHAVGANIYVNEDTSRSVGDGDGDNDGKVIDDRSDNDNSTGFVVNNDDDDDDNEGDGRKMSEATETLKARLNLDVKTLGSGCNPRRNPSKQAITGANHPSATKKEKDKSANDKTRKQPRRDAAVTNVIEEGETETVLILPTSKETNNEFPREDEDDHEETLVGDVDEDEKTNDDESTYDYEYDNDDDNEREQNIVERNNVDYNLEEDERYVLVPGNNDAVAIINSLDYDRAGAVEVRLLEPPLHPLRAIVHVVKNLEQPSQLQPPRQSANNRRRKQARKDKAAEKENGGYAFKSRQKHRQEGGTIATAKTGEEARTCLPDAIYTLSILLIPTLKSRLSQKTVRSYFDMSGETKTDPNSSMAKVFCKGMGINIVHQKSLSHRPVKLLNAPGGVYLVLLKIILDDENEAFHYVIYDANKKEIYDNDRNTEIIVIEECDLISNRSAAKAFIPLCPKAKDIWLTSVYLGCVDAASASSAAITQKVDHGAITRLRADAQHPLHHNLTKNHRTTTTVATVATTAATTTATTTTTTAEATAVLAAADDAGANNKRKHCEDNQMNTDNKSKRIRTVVDHDDMRTCDDCGVQSCSFSKKSRKKKSAVVRCIDCTRKIHGKHQAERMKKKKKKKATVRQE